MIDACISLSDRVLTKGRPNDIYSEQPSRAREGRRREHDGKVFRLVIGKSTGNRCLAA